MSDLEQAAQMALEVLETVIADVKTTPAAYEGQRQAIASLRQALEQPKKEPVAWGAFYFGGKRNGKLYSACDTKEQIEHYIADRHQSDDSNTFRAAPLYTVPPKREWVGLTREEVKTIAKELYGFEYDIGVDSFRAIEAKLKEKNHGNK